MRLPLLVVVMLVAVVAAGCGSAGQPRFRVGAVEDAAKAGDANAAMQLAAASGFSVVVLSSVWTRGAAAPSPDELAALQRASIAADGADIEPIVAVYSFSSNTPDDQADRDQFASYTAAVVRAVPQLKAVIVGNEPNLNLFWLPQYDAAGGDAAAAAFEALLARTYDAVKEARHSVEVIGAGLAAH